jgi:hypothetical protein
VLGIDPHSRAVSGQNALLIAAMDGSYQALLYAFQNLKIDPRITTNEGLNIVHAGAISGSLETMKAVLYWDNTGKLNLFSAKTKRGHDVFFLAKASPYANTDVLFEIEMERGVDLSYIPSLRKFKS